MKTFIILFLSALLLLSLPLLSKSINGKINNSLIDANEITICGNYFTGKGNETFPITIRDKAEIESLRLALQVNNLPFYESFVCGCDGYPIINVSGVKIAIHHESNLSITNGDSNYFLKDKMLLIDWMRRHNIPLENELAKIK